MSNRTAFITGMATGMTLLMALAVWSANRKAYSGH